MLRTIPMARWGGLALVILVCLAGSARLPGQEVPAGPKQTAAPPSQPAKDLAAKVRPFFAQHCLECHGPEKTKGHLRVDQLTGDFSRQDQLEHWRTILQRLQAGEMPPKSKPRPPQAEVRIVADWIQAQVQAAAAVRRAQGRTVLRRLNRTEYENTICDLLGVKIHLQDMLPLDSAAAGFDNVGEALHTSSFLLEKYLEAAEKALSVAIANGPQPPLVKQRYRMQDQHQVKTTTERVFRKLDDGGVVMFSSSAWQALHLYQFYPPHRGSYRFRIAAAGHQSAGQPVTFRVDAGMMGMVGQNHLVGYFDVPADKTTVVDFVDHLEARGTMRLHPYGLASAQMVDKIGADQYQGKGLAVHYVEVEGPLHDAWPPPSHRRIFGDLPQKPAPGSNQNGRVEVVSDQPQADAERILHAFARRAFRREVSDQDLQPILKLVKDRLAQKYTFEQAVRVGLSAILVSPNFLFLREPPGQLDDFALASRLSYFLWSTLPDDELLKLAEQKKLGDPKILHAQVERLLQDPRAAAFTENFVSQWLGLRDIDATMPSHILYPEYDEMLKESMLRETYKFWDEVLRHDLSLLNFVHADFALLNGRLARHYGIKLPPGEKGGDWEIRKVQLPKDSNRGGLLTMASVLKVTANGTYTSPILRGAWVLDRILGTPPPRPPEGIPAVEPDIRGATTIRQQLAKHRQLESCAACHAKIDPPGFALESFDVIGGWRDHYRTSGNGKEVLLEGRRMPYLQGLKVDPADQMADGRPFRDINEFKRLLLKDKDQIARALTTRLVTYATGAAPQATDQPEIDALVRAVKDRDYGLRALVHQVVGSELFRKK